MTGTTIGLIMFIFSVIVGITLVVIAITVGLNKGNNDSIKQNNSDILEQNLIKAVEDADNAIEQLNSMSSLVFEELESKYKELLFLYQLIEEKRMEVSNIYSKNMELIATNKSLLSENEKINKSKAIITVKTEELKPDAVKNESLPTANNNPRFNEILTLFSEGKSISEIAKSLNIGQGEVKLIIELNKAR